MLYIYYTVPLIEALYLCHRLPSTATSTPQERRRQHASGKRRRRASYAVLGVGRPTLIVGREVAQEYPGTKL